MKYEVRFAREAQQDLIRLYDFILERGAADLAIAERALSAIENGIRFLTFSPFTCRKATSDSQYLRELIIPFGSTGYVALFEIESDTTVTILAIRHQREDDYH